ncbi:hypothetical protein ABFX02_10G151900 [Erythranthe guttata]
MKKAMVVSSAGLCIGYCLGLLLNESPKEKHVLIRSLKSVSRWIWCNSIDYYNALIINPVQCSTADQDAVPCSTADQDDSSSPKMPDGDNEFAAETRHVSPHFLTKIESFSLLSEYGIEKYETRVFESGDYKWRLIIYPDGNESQDKGNHVSVYLAMADTSSLPVDWEIDAIFTIFLYNQISDKYLCYRVSFNETKFKWGFPKLISKKKLRDQSNGYLVHDTLVLGAEVFVCKRQQRVTESVTLHRPTKSPQKREWKIQGFSKLGNDPWFSEEFTIRSLDWKMRLYPNGYQSSKGRAMSMFLTCVSAKHFDAHTKVKVRFIVSVKGGSNSDARYNTENLNEWFTSSNRSWGQLEFIEHDELQGFIVDDCFTLEVNICVQLIVL